MENIVFIELLKNGLEPWRDVLYFKDNIQNGVDLIIKYGS